MDNKRSDTAGDPTATKLDKKLDEKMGMQLQHGEFS